MSALTAPHGHEDVSRPVAWHKLAWIAWRQHRIALLSLAVIIIGYGAVMAITGPPAHPAFLNYYRSWGIVNIVHVLPALPLVVGVFVGAPLVAAEYENGTFRFAWTQGPGGVRLMTGKVVMIAAAGIVTLTPLGFIAYRWLAPFQAIGLSDRWSAQTFEVSGLLLPAWTAFAFCLGVLIGTLTRKTVAAMATTGAVLAGLMGLTLLKLHSLVLSLAPSSARDTALAAAVGAQGAVNRPAVAGVTPGPTGGWIISGHYATAAGHPVSANAALALEGHLAGKKAPQQLRWLAHHGYSYWISYQPGSRYWLTQGIEAAVLLGLAAGLALTAMILIARRS